MYSMERERWCKLWTSGETMCMLVHQIEEMHHSGERCDGRGSRVYTGVREKYHCLPPNFAVNLKLL